MARLRRLVHLLVAALALQLCGTASAQALEGPVTASSEWGPGYGAVQAADTIRDENGNYWQTPQGKDQGAWWQQDLGHITEITAVRIFWARYEDRVHCPPAKVIVEVSVVGANGPWTAVRSVGRDELPRDRQPYDPDRVWRYPLPRPTPARFVRLVFPEGGQAGAKYPGYLCLGEVEIEGKGLGPKIVAIAGGFGKAEVDVNRPSLVNFWLASPCPGPNRPFRTRDQSVLAQSGLRPWARGGYTYAVTPEGKRYESRLSRAQKTEVAEQGGRNVIRLTGVLLSAGQSTDALATEDWALSSLASGGELVWRIVRRWNKDCAVGLSGSPALFFRFDARRAENSVTSTIWYDPLRIAARHASDYAVVPPMPGRISENLLQTIRDRNTWAIYKLWTNWHAPCDLRLEVEGGHLYRRGGFAWLSEAGAVTDPAPLQVHKAGQVEQITLKISPVDKQTTGYQLAVELPDRATEASLKDFYTSVLNGGSVNDQKGFDFGNESDGWYYAGSSWMYGVAVAAGVPASGRLASHPYHVAWAFRQHLAHIFSVLDSEGRAHFGYNQGGEWVDDNLHTIIGARAYLLHSGDLPFVRQHLPAMERMLAYFIKRRNAEGLFKLGDVGAHWYYDAITTGGVNAYYNAFLFKAANDLAEMEEAAGRHEQAREYRAVAASVKAAFNRVLWKETAPGGPRYLDWIDAKGHEIAYFCDLCQWPPIAVGIASPEQARKIIATADARIQVLEKEHGYQGFAGLSALWPVPREINPHAWQTFGIYMNGGSLLCQTYWEVLARARAGDSTGAVRRMRLFAARAAETSWAGDNAATIRGEMKNGDGEPYLADMVAVTAAAVHGILGIEPTWKSLHVEPHLPPDWPRAQAEILYKGRRHRVTVEGGKARIEPLEQQLRIPPLWMMDTNLRTGPGGAATATNVDLADAGKIVLAKASGNQAGYVASGSYTTPPCHWGMAVLPVEMTVAAELHGGTVTATVQTSDDDFKTTRSETVIRLRDGVHAYDLDRTGQAARGVRVRFDLTRGPNPSTTPLVDGFRLAGTEGSVESP